MVLSVYVYVFVRTYMQALKFYQLVFVRLLSVRMKFVRMFVRYCMQSREQLVDQLRLLKLQIAIRAIKYSTHTQHS